MIEYNIMFLQFKNAMLVCLSADGQGEKSFLSVT